MRKLLNFLRSPSKAIEAQLPFDAYKVKKEFRSLLVYESTRLSVIYIFAFPWCTTQEIEKCKAVLQDPKILKIWLLFHFPLLSWSRQKCIEKDTENRCYFYQIQKGKYTLFDRRRVCIEGGRYYTTHPFTLTIDRPYKTGLEGDFAFRIKTHRNLAKALKEKTTILKKRPSVWKALNHQNTYKTSTWALYEFLLKKLES